MKDDLVRLLITYSASRFFSVLAEVCLEKRDNAHDPAVSAFWEIAARETSRLKRRAEELKLSQKIGENYA